jgi:hypothetical protein
MHYQRMWRYGDPVRPNTSIKGLSLEQAMEKRTVRDGDCIVWTGERVGMGYGRVSYKGRRPLAHRVAWELANGPIPDGLLVLHRCDNPPCCNANHLFLGTSKDNADDRDAKGRIARVNGAYAKP